MKCVREEVMKIFLFLSLLISIHVLLHVLVAKDGTIIIFQPTKYVLAGRKSNGTSMKNSVMHCHKE